LSKCTTDVVGVCAEGFLIIRLGGWSWTGTLQPAIRKAGPERTPAASPASPQSGTHFAKFGMDRPEPMKPRAPQDDDQKSFGANPTSLNITRQ